LQHLDPAHRHARRKRRWLEDDRIARDQCRGHLPRRNRHRKVPWRDDARYADRLPHGHVELVRQLGWSRLTVEPTSLAGHVEGHVDRFLNVTARLGDDLAHLLGHLARELLLAIVENLRRLEEQLAALRSRVQTPALERPRGCLDRRIDVLRRALGVLGYQLAVGRIAPFKGPAADGIDPLAIDQVLEMLGQFFPPVTTIPPRPIV
jgi:hypothetical protein